VTRDKSTDETAPIGLHFARIHADEYNYRQISRYTVAHGSKPGRAGETERASNKRALVNSGDGRKIVAACGRRSLTAFFAGVTWTVRCSHQRQEEGELHTHSAY